MVSVDVKHHVFLLLCFEVLPAPRQACNAVGLRHATFNTPFPPFSPSLISLMVSVGVKHRVYFICGRGTAKGSAVTLDVVAVVKECHVGGCDLWALNRGPAVGYCRRSN